MVAGTSRTEISDVVSQKRERVCASEGLCLQYANPYAVFILRRLARPDPVVLTRADPAAVQRCGSKWVV